MKKTESILEISGGITCDGLKKLSKGDKLYDCVHHYDSIKQNPTFPSIPTYIMERSVLSISEYSGTEDADSLREMIDNKIVILIGRSQTKFSSHFTFVTYFSSTMAREFNYSVPQRLVTYCEKCVGCVYNHLNRYRKPVMGL